MNLSVVERLEIVRKNEGLNKAQFERTLDKSTGYLNMLIRRGSSPSVDVIQKFSYSFPNYSLSWLLTGKGSMLKDSSNSSVLNEDSTTNIESLKQENESLKKEIETLKAHNKTLQDYNEMLKLQLGMDNISKGA